MGVATALLHLVHGAVTPAIPEVITASTTAGVAIAERFQATKLRVRSRKAAEPAPAPAPVDLKFLKTSQVTLDEILKRQFEDQTVADWKAAEKRSREALAEMTKRADPFSYRPPAPVVLTEYRGPSPTYESHHGLAYSGDSPNSCAWPRVPETKTAPAFKPARLTPFPPAPIAGRPAPVAPGKPVRRAKSATLPAVQPAIEPLEIERDDTITLSFEPMELASTDDQSGLTFSLAMAGLGSDFVSLTQAGRIWLLFRSDEAEDIPDDDLPDLVDFARDGADAFEKLIVQAGLEGDHRVSDLSYEDPSSVELLCNRLNDLLPRSRFSASPFKVLKRPPLQEGV